MVILNYIKIHLIIHKVYSMYVCIHMYVCMYMYIHVCNDLAMHFLESKPSRLSFLVIWRRVLCLVASPCSFFSSFHRTGHVLFTLPSYN